VRRHGNWFIALANFKRHVLVNQTVTGTDIPFVQDGFRDGERIRDWMHNRIVGELQQRSKPYVIVKGSHDRRMRDAVAAIDRLPATSQLV